MQPTLRRLRPIRGPMITTDLRTDTSALLSALIRINTTNPPGNETAAAEHLAAYLAEAGVTASSGR